MKKIIQLNGDILRKAKKFFLNGIILTVTSFMMKCIGMVFSLYVSNKIGSEAVGVFSLVMSIYLFAITLATSGLTIACTYLVSEQFAQKNYLAGLKAVKTCLLFSLLLGLGSSCLVWLFSDTISKNFLNSMVSSIPLYLISIGLPFISLSSVLNGYFSAVRKAYKTAFSQIFELVIKILVSVVLLNFSKNQTVENICINLILADVISEVCSCCFLFFLYKIDKHSLYLRNISGITFKKRILKITLPVSITSYIRSGLSTIKQFMIPSRLALFGLPYSIALAEYGKINGMTMSVLMFPNVFIQSFSNLLIPEFSSLFAKQYKKRILVICQKVFWATSLFSIAISIIFFFFANEISYRIFKNLECANYIKILSPLVLFIYTDNIIDSILKGLNKQFGVMVCNILDLVLVISILYFLLPSFGITGYLLAIMISEIFNFCISFFLLYHATGFKMSICSIGCYALILGIGIYELITIML